MINSGQVPEQNSFHPRGVWGLAQWPSETLWSHNLETLWGTPLCF